MRLFEGWHRLAEDLVEAAEESAILRTDIYDRESLGERWGRGRVRLLGKAAQSMTPNVDQGACQTIEDAVLLARCPDEGGAKAGALRGYERLRADRTAMMVRRSRRVGVVDQPENPLPRWLRGRGLAMIPLKVQLRQLEEVVGYEA